MMIRSPDWSALRQTQPIWESMDGEIILASSLRLLRNLSRFKFVSKLDEQANKQLLKFLSAALLSHPNLKHPLLLKGEQMMGDDKEFLFERFLFLDGINQASSGEAFAFDQTGQFLAIINLVEHLQLLLIKPGERIDQLLSELITIESHLSESLDFAFSPRFGFLTAQPARCGTGLIANMLLHLPALVQTGQLLPLLNELEHAEISIAGLTAEGFVADLVILENKQTIALSEEKIISNLQSFASRLSIAENSQRKKLQSHSSSEIIDRVARAYGLVRHSYILEMREAMQALSLIKLGTLMGWIEGIDQRSINHWLFSLQRAHLRHQLASQQVSQEPRSSSSSESLDLNHQRALTLHKLLEPSKLLI